MIRVRCISRRWFPRPSYEVEYHPTVGGQGWHKVTAYPVFDIEKVVRTGDAWALIKAADQAWNGLTGDWVTMLEPGQRP